jgi:hypothetical protein
LFNPGNKDVEVAIKFECKNCSEDFDFLGIKAKKTSYIDNSVYPEKMLIEKNTVANVSKGFVFSVSSPLFIRHELVFPNFRIPYLSLNIGKKIVNGEIQATLVNSIVSLTVTSKVKLILEGINPLFLLLFVSVLVFSITLFIYYRRKSELKKMGIV